MRPAPDWVTFLILILLVIILVLILGDVHFD